VIVNGSCAVTSAETSNDESGTHAVAPGRAGSGTGRNGLGSTREAIAEVAADWSERRCGLKAVPMVSSATTTVVSAGLTGVVFGLSVLSMGGGGFAAQLLIKVSTATAGNNVRHAARFPAPTFTLGNSTVRSRPLPDSCCRAGKRHGRSDIRGRANASAS
jgi:hypothetical protein